MKNLILFLSLLCLTFSISGQSDFKLTTGPVIKEKSKILFTYFGEKDGNHYFGGNKLYKKDYTLFALDSKFDLVKMKEIDPEYKLISFATTRAGQYGFNLAGIDGENLVFLRPDLKKGVSSSIETFYKESHSIESLEKSKNSEKISEPSMIVGSGFFGNKDVGVLMQAESNSRENRVFLLASENLSKDNVEFQIIRLDKSFNVIYNSSLRPELRAADFSREAVAITDQGHVFLLAAKTLEGKKLTEYMLYKYSPEGELESMITFNPGSYVFSTPSLEIHPDGSLILCGYTSTESNDDIDGMAYLRFNSSDLSVDVNKYFDLPSEFDEISSNMKNGIIKRFGSAQSVLLDNGSVAVAVEHLERGRTSGLVFGDIYAVTFDSNGELASKGVLRKEQTAGDRYYRFASFKLFSHDNDVFVLYSDHPKNSEIKPYEKPKTAIMTGYYTMYKADLRSTGFEKTALYRSNKDNMRTAIDKVYQSKDGTIIFLEDGQAKSGFRVRKLEL